MIYTSKNNNYYKSDLAQKIMGLEDGLFFVQPSLSVSVRTVKRVEGDGYLLVLEESSGLSDGYSLSEDRQRELVKKFNPGDKVFIVYDGRNIIAMQGPASADNLYVKTD